MVKTSHFCVKLSIISSSLVGVPKTKHKQRKTLNDPSWRSMSFPFPSFLSLWQWMANRPDLFVHDPHSYVVHNYLHDEKQFEAIFIIAINIRFDHPTRRVTCGQSYCALFMSYRNEALHDDRRYRSIVFYWPTFCSALNVRESKRQSTLRRVEKLSNRRTDGINQKTLLFVTPQYKVSYWAPLNFLFEFFSFSPFVIIFFIIFLPLPQLASSELIASERDKPKANIKVRSKVLCDANNKIKGKQSNGKQKINFHSNSIFRDKNFSLLSRR